MVKRVIREVTLTDDEDFLNDEPGSGVEEGSATTEPPVVPPTKTLPVPNYPGKSSVMFCFNLDISLMIFNIYLFNGAVGTFLASEIF